MEARNPNLSNGKVVEIGGADKPVAAWNETLRLLAAAPAPQGLESRLVARLRASQDEAAAGVLAWPVAPVRRGLLARGWVRAAAAVVLAALVTGGGWMILSHGRPAADAARTLPQTARPTVPQAGFSSAGAMRTPQTLAGPLAPGEAQAAAGLEGAGQAGAGQASRRIVLAQKVPAATGKKNAAQ